MSKVYNKDLGMCQTSKKIPQAKLKTAKRVTVATTGIFLAMTMVVVSVLGSKGWSKDNSVKNNTETTIIEKTNNSVSKTKQQAYKDMQQVLNTELKTYKSYFKDDDGVKRKYDFVYEQDLLQLSGDMSIALEDYFKACGASYWTDEDEQQFWPKDIECIVTAIAYKESTYRVNVENDLGCKGLTGLKETALLNSLDNWLVPATWGNDMTHISFDENAVDMFNPTTCIEYTYYNIGYNLVHWYKNDKTFVDKDGARKSVWDTIPYTEEMQVRMIVATHLYGIGNMLDAVYQRPNVEGKIVPLDDYIYSDYVEDVLDKTYELKNTYNRSLAK